jgi:23S rRNA pseudouridine2604 synthase
MHRLRIDAYIGKSGHCSRREAERLVKEGRVTVNGKRANAFTEVQEGDEVLVDGNILNMKKELVYLAMNKPAGVTATTEEGVENNIISLVGHSERIFPVGGLDKDSEGLILLTNDGEIVNAMMRPQHKQEKEYMVTLDKQVINRFQLAQIAAGVKLTDAVTEPCIIEHLSGNTYRVVLTQGLNRQIRRMFGAFGYEVRKLVRVRVMHIVLGSMRPGEWRDLTPMEKEQLFAALALKR